MNSMTEALQTAGVKLPSVRERVYNVIRDNPGWTQKQIIALTKLPFQDVSKRCNELVAAGLIKAKRPEHGASVGTMYQCDLVRFPKYEWERSPNKAGRPRKNAVPAPVVAPTPAPPVQMQEVTLKLGVAAMQAIALAAEAFEREHGFRPTRDQTVTMLLTKHVKGA